MSTEFNDVVPAVLSAVAGIIAITSLLGAFRSGVLKRVRLGNLELEGEASADAAELRKRISATLAEEDIPYEVEQLTNYYSQILAQSKTSFWFSLVFASLGFVAILAAAFLFGATDQASTVAQFIAGVIMEAVASLFFVQSKNAQKSMGEFFDKLRSDRNHLESRRLSDSIENPLVKDALKLQLSLHYSGVSDASSVAEKILQNSAEEKQGVTV